MSDVSSLELRDKEICQCQMFLPLNQGTRKYRPLLVRRAGFFLSLIYILAAFLYHFTDFAKKFLYSILLLER